MRHAGDCDQYECEAVQEAPDCIDGLDHRWTARNMGGCDQNPGCWSMGGTTIVEKRRCVLCGCVRTECYYGSQRNPGQCDTVAYEADGRDVDEEEAQTERRRQRRNMLARRRRRLADQAKGEVRS